MNKKIIVYLIVGSFLLSGCGGLFKKIVFGSSLSDFQDANTQREQTFALSQEECYKRTLGFIKEADAHVANTDSSIGFISAVRFEKFYYSCINTTEVGILIESPKEGTSTVRVMSHNSDLANAVADTLYKFIENPKLKIEKKIMTKLALPGGNKESSKIATR